MQLPVVLEGNDLLIFQFGVDLFEHGSQFTDLFFDGKECQYESESHDD